ncbi:MAG: methyltransferase domain-containing protein [Desulfobacteraceae bacterium]|jgi:SAM-dependent methyltransferase
MKQNLARSATLRDLDFEHLICTELVKLNSLHYGYWDGDEELTLENFRRAQDRYTQTLIALIPQQVTRILDVGCGIGDVSMALVSKGYIVTALSPDKNQKKYFEGYDHKNLAFLNTDFESFWTGEKFDLVLMSESQNYFDMDLGFKKCASLLDRVGYLLVSGNFRIDDSKEFRRVTHIESEYIERASHYGFSLTKSIDITENILPTVQFGEEIYKSYFSPSLGTLKYYIQNAAPIRLKLLKWIFRKELKQLMVTLRDWSERANPALFRERVRYMRFLFTFQ